MATAGGGSRAATAAARLLPEPPELCGEQQKLPERFFHFLTQGPGRGGWGQPFPQCAFQYEELSSLQELSTAYWALCMFFQDTAFCFPGNFPLPSLKIPRCSAGNFPGTLQAISFFFPGKCLCCFLESSIPVYDFPLCLEDLHCFPGKSPHDSLVRGKLVSLQTLRWVEVWVLTPLKWVPVSPLTLGSRFVAGSWHRHGSAQPEFLSFGVQ